MNGCRQTSLHHGSRGIQPKLERIDYYATTYECPQCKETEDPRFIKDEGTPALIPGSYASSGLAAHVMYYKYVMSMPLHRQEKDFEHLGGKDQPYGHGQLDHLLRRELLFANV